VLRMGWVARFLSRAVVTGFLFGAAIDVVVGELPKLTGTEASGDNSFQELRSWLGSLGDLQTATLLVGLVALVVVFGLRVIAPAIPGALVLVVGGLLSTVLFDLDERGVALVGDIPSGLPSVDVPDLGLLWDHAAVGSAAAVALVLIGFSQTAGSAKAFATKHRYQVDIDQETVAQGMANVGAGLLQGMPVTTSLSASSLNDHSGARSGLASLTSGAVVLLTLLFLAPLFSDLPKPVLAALIIEAVVMGMMDVPELRRLARVQKVDFWVAITAILGTLAFGVLAGVVFGIGLSLLWLVAVTTRPDLPLLGRRAGTTVFRELSEFPEDEQFPGVAVIRLDGGLFFATSEALDERVRQVIRQTPDVICLVIDCSAISFVDSQGAAQLAEIVTIAEEERVTLRLARLKPAVRATLARDGIFTRITEDRIHASVDQAVQAQLGAPPSPPDVATE
jgi:SulP family sulfate permease